MKRILVGFINLYQHSLSIDHGWLSFSKLSGHCRFYPSCSQYAKRAIQEYKFPRYVFLILWRVIRCNPFNSGGYDPPESKFKVTR